MDQALIVTQEEFPTGLACIDCGEPVEVGQCYSERLIGFHGDIPMTELVCVPCGFRAQPA